MVESDGFDEKLGLLESIVMQGIEKLLAEAASRNILEAPFGRKPEPTPLVSEENWEVRIAFHLYANFYIYAVLTMKTTHALQIELQSSVSSGMQIGDISTIPAPCEFEFGFDALKFLSQYIEWAHPNAIERRTQEKATACQALQYRMQHAKTQLKVGKSLLDLAEKQSSGVLWGPLTSPVSHSSVVCLAKPLKLGTMVFQVSETADFSDDFKTYQEKVKFDGVDSSMNMIPVRVTVTDLKPNCSYYVRCCLQDSPSAPLFAGPEAGKFQISRFQTIPNEEDPPDTSSSSSSNSSILSFSCYGQLPVPVRSYECNVPFSGRSCDALPSSLMHCILGDIFALDANNVENQIVGNEKQEYSERVSKLFNSSHLFNEATSLFRTGSLLLSWRDSAPNAAQYIRDEESAVREYAKQLKKYQKKYGNGSKSKSKSSKSGDQKIAPPPPTLMRPAPRVAFSSLIEVPLRRAFSETVS